MTGAGILVNELINQGVKTVFGYPGGQVLNIYDQLYKNSNLIEHVLTAHEQGAAHAADGYARVTGKVGVVIATSGPGATNIVTGIANAYLDSVPIVAITGNVPTHQLGRDSFQEVDIVGITLPIVKHSFIVKDVAQLEYIIKEAFKIAVTGRPGPVLIDVPKDVQLAECEYPQNQKKQLVFEAYAKRCEYKENIPDAIKLIEQSQRPYIYCGGGVTASSASEQVVELSRKISAPIGLSMMGISAVPASYEMNLGMTGMHGKYAASVLKSHADLIIAIGVRFSDRATGDTSKYANGTKIIQIDIDPAEINKNIPAFVEMIGDISDVLGDLIEACPEKTLELWKSEIEEKKAEQAVEQSEGMAPWNVIRTVQKYCKPETVIATDVGQHQMWVMQGYLFEKPRTLLTSGGLGTMGYGMGAAIGGCIASGRTKTVLFTGDGSFGMNLNELATAVSQNLPLVIVIMNNGTLGMVRQWQTQFYGKRYSHTTLNRKTDFVKLANAFGAEGYMAETPEQLDNALKLAWEQQTPALIDCRIDMDYKVLPMIPPGGSIKDMILEA